jgi:hypothetical protein
MENLIAHACLSRCSIVSAICRFFLTIAVFSFLNICFHLKVGSSKSPVHLDYWSKAKDFNGMVDALRLWNDARSDICETMYCDIDMFRGKLQYFDLLRMFSSVKIVTLSECQKM